MGAHDSLAPQQSGMIHISTHHGQQPGQGMIPLAAMQPESLNGAGTLSSRNIVGVRDVSDPLELDLYLDDAFKRATQ